MDATVQLSPGAIAEMEASFDDIARELHAAHSEQSPEGPAIIAPAKCRTKGNSYMRLLQRLPESFDSARAEQAQAYLATLREAWRETSTALTRNSWIIVVLLTAYELAGRGAISKVTIGPLTLANLKYISVFVPTVVSYVFYEQILLVVRWIESETTYRYLMRTLSPKIEELDFDALLAPQLPALSNLVHSYSPTSQTASKNVRSLAQYALALLLFLSVPLFDAFALTELSRHFGAASVVFWINAALTAALVILATAVLGLWLVEERLVW
jgi:hypothetical protein